MPDVFKRAVLEAKSHIECYSCFSNGLKYPKCLVQYLLPFIQKKNYFTTRKKEFSVAFIKDPFLRFMETPNAKHHKIQTSDVNSFPILIFYQLICSDFCP